MKIDRYTLKAFFKITGPLWIVGTITFAAYFAPWVMFVVLGCILLVGLVGLGYVVKDEAAQMRSDVYNHRT